MAQSPVASLIDGFIRTASLPKSKSVGNYVGPIGKLGNRCWEAKESMRLLFYDQIRPGILEHLDGLFSSVSTRDTINVTLYMIGRRSNTATPTVLFVSENDSNRKDARKLIKESGILRQHRGWKTAEASKDPGWGARLEQLASGLGSNKHADVSEPATQVLYDSSQPLQSQGMTLYVSHDSGLRKMTANLLRYDGKTFFLAPSHAFFKNDDKKMPDCNSSDDDFEIDSDDETATIPAADVALCSSAIEVDCDESDVCSSSDDSEESVVFSVRESDGEVLSQTSLGSFENTTLWPTFDEALPSNTTRARFRTPTQKVDPPPASDLAPIGVLSHWSVDKDWALVEVRSDNDTLLAAFLDAEQEDLTTKPVAGCSSAGAAIVTHTASKGEVTGIMSSTSSDIRLPHGTCFQEVYAIRLDAAIADGDCGSAVFDAITGELYGHIIAGCRTSGFAYVMPAHGVMPDLYKAINSAEVVATEPAVGLVDYKDYSGSVTALLSTPLAPTQSIGEFECWLEQESPGVPHTWTLPRRMADDLELYDDPRSYSGYETLPWFVPGASTSMPFHYIGEPGRGQSTLDPRRRRRSLLNPSRSRSYDYGNSERVLPRFDSLTPCSIVNARHEITADNLAKLEREHDPVVKPQHSGDGGNLICWNCNKTFTGIYRKGNFARHVPVGRWHVNAHHDDWKAASFRPGTQPYAPCAYCGHGGYHDPGDRNGLALLTAEDIAATKAARLSLHVCEKAVNSDDHCVASSINACNHPRQNSPAVVPIACDAAALSETHHADPDERRNVHDCEASPHCTRCGCDTVQCPGCSRDPDRCHRHAGECWDCCQCDQGHHDRCK